MEIDIFEGASSGDFSAPHLVRYDIDPTPAQPRRDAGIRILRDVGGMIVEGTPSATRPYAVAPVGPTEVDVAATVRAASTLILALPAHLQEACFKEIASTASDGLAVVVENGKFGALRLAHHLRKQGRDPNDLLIAETSPRLAVARIRGNQAARNADRPVSVAALNGGRTADVLARLQTAPGHYVAAESVLATSLGDAGCALRAVTTLLNLARLEAEGPYRRKRFDITPQTARMVAAVDAERCAVAAAFGVEVHSLLDQIEAEFGLSAGGVYERIAACNGFDDQVAPSSARHRFVADEVPYGLVPLLHLGRIAGVSMPATDAIVTLASVVNDEDYRTTGRTLDSLGLSVQTVDEVVASL